MGDEIKRILNKCRHRAMTDCEYRYILCLLNASPYSGVESELSKKELINLAILKLEVSSYDRRGIATKIKQIKDKR